MGLAFWTAVLADGCFFIQKKNKQEQIKRGGVLSWQFAPGGRDVSGVMC